jgi:hypothetical protein
MTLLGMIFGSKEYGLYDLDKSQSFFELALVRGDLEAYSYLVRILRAKMAAKAALEKQNMENFGKMDSASQQKLIQELAKDASAESITLAACSNPACDQPKVNIYDAAHVKRALTAHGNARKSIGRMDIRLYVH